MIKFIPIGSKNEKGKALERVFGAVLTNLGYIDLRYNPQRIGEEIDIKGKHKITTRSIKCQCKAHAAEIPTHPLRTFLGDVVSERGRKPNTDGMFISSSGFNSTALEWYDNLSDNEKDYLKLVDANKLFDFLKASKVVCSEEELKSSVLKKTKIPYKDSSLIMSDRGVFWEVKLEDEHSGEIYNMMLDSYGEQVKIVDRDYLLSKSELSSKTYIMLKIKENILLELLKNDVLNINELILTMDEPKAEIKASIANLLAERLIEKTSEKIALRKEIDTLFGLTRYFDDSGNLILFMRSDYFNDTVNSILISFILTKFRLYFTKVETKAITNIIKISPSALKYCLFGDSTRYVNQSRQLDKLTLDKSERSQYELQSRSHFIQKLTRNLMTDCELDKNTELLDKRGIILTKLETHIALAKEFESYLKVTGGKTFNARTHLNGPLKDGEFVTPDNPITFLKIGNAALTMEEYDLARNQYDNIIKYWDKKDNFVVEAIKNKGLSYLAEDKYDKAKKEFDMIRFIETVRPQVLIELCKCYKSLGYDKALMNTLIVISKKWPEEAVELKEQLRSIT